MYTPDSFFRYEIIIIIITTLIIIINITIFFKPLGTHSLNETIYTYSQEPLEKQYI